MAKRRGKRTTPSSPGKGRCVDCIAAGITTDRPTPYGGPRSPLCVTHHRQRKKKLSARNHARRTENTFGLTVQEYQALYVAQGGRCAVCRVATGRARRLAVDHDHETGIIRGLCCSQCNYVLLGRFGPDAMRRALEYLENPPAVAVIGCRRIPDPPACPGTQ